MGVRMSPCLNACEVTMEVQGTSELFKIHALCSKPHLHAIQYMYQTEIPLKAKSDIILTASCSPHW